MFSGILKNNSSPKQSNEASGCLVALMLTTMYMWTMLLLMVSDHCEVSETWLSFHSCPSAAESLAVSDLTSDLNLAVQSSSWHAMNEEKTWVVRAVLYTPRSSSFSLSRVTQASWTPSVACVFGHFPLWVPHIWVACPRYSPGENAFDFILSYTIEVSLQVSFPLSTIFLLSLWRLH